MKSVTSRPGTAAAYLSALIDGEGMVTKPGYGRAIRVSNTDMGIIEACSECCITLGLRHKVTTWSRPIPGYKQVYVVNISGRDTLMRAAKILDLRSAAKVARLNDAITSYQYKPPCSAEHLRNLYEVEGRSVREIAGMYDRSEPSIWHWIKRYEIPKRTQGESLALAWATKRRT